MACDIRSKGLSQFIAAYKRHKDREDDPFYFGEEIEGMIVKFDSERKIAQIDPKSLQVLEILWRNPTNRIMWKPEFASYMIESSPETPYNGLLTTPEEIEQSMIGRRREVNSKLPEHERVLTIASFPRLGDIKDINAAIIHPNGLVTDVPRYRNMNDGILKIIHSDVDIKVPVFNANKRTTNSDKDVIDQYSVPHEDYNEIRMDSLTFGLGCCSLQVTFQAPNLYNALFLYDQLVNICPVMLSTSYNNGNGRLPRFEPVPCYTCPENQSKNDTRVDVDIQTFQKLLNEGLDSSLALHIANLFSRKPLLPINGIEDHDDDLSHFNYLQKTNWHTVRLKLPSEEHRCGWTNELRLMDVQVTDFENTSYVVFVMLLAKVIMEYKLNFAVPISKVDQNIETASKVDAVKREKFLIPINILRENTPKDVVSIFERSYKLQDNGYVDEQNNPIFNASETTEYDYLYISDIVCGSDRFVGLLPVIRHYLTTRHLRCYKKYLDLIENRAKGKNPTTAHAIRNFVLTHPQYQHDCVVSEQIHLDLLSLIAEHTENNIILM